MKGHWPWKDVVLKEPRQTNWIFSQGDYPEHVSHLRDTTALNSGNKRSFDFCSKFLKLIQYLNEYLKCSNVKYVTAFRELSLCSLLSYSQHGASHLLCHLLSIQLWGGASAQLQPQQRLKLAPARRHAECYWTHLRDTRPTEQVFRQPVSQPSEHSLSDFGVAGSSCTLQLPDGFAGLEDVLLDKCGRLRLQSQPYILDLS